MSNFKSKYENLAELVNGALDGYMPEKRATEANLYKAMRYSLLAGGKRLRPVLSLAVCELLGGRLENILPFACAIEMIHTYSLIHDDLPAMDNDDYRRGRLTSHKVFGEAMAILAGDGLLNSAFEVMADFSLREPSEYEKSLKALKIIANSSGAGGMIAGQVVDMESEGRASNSEQLDYMHRHKTGAIISAAAQSAAVLCGAREEQLSAISEYAALIGLAFQIKDDILDVTGDSALLGKKTMSDQANEKTTYVTLYGIEESKRRLESIIGQAISTLGIFGDEAWFLRELAQYIACREN